MIIVRGMLVFLVNLVRHSAPAVASVRPIFPRQPIAVERSMYSNAIGQMWAAVTNATGSPLP